MATLLSHLRRRPLLAALAGCGTAATAYLAPDYIARRRAQPVLNTRTFTPYALVAKHRVSQTSSVFVLRPPGPAAGATPVLDGAWAADTLWSVQAKQPQLQIGREYTPLPPAARAALGGGDGGGEYEDSAADLHLLIRKEMNGEMTTYLHGLPEQAEVELRGPFPDVRVPPGCDEILFIAGGTGISPALQAAHIMARRGAKMHILWANRWREECVGGANERAAERQTSELRGWVARMWPASQVRDAAPQKAGAEKGIIVRVIDAMKAGVPEGALQVQYFVDEEDTFVRRSDVQRILAASAAADRSKPSTKLIMVSGPEGFIDYWAGRKRVDDTTERQGPLEGILGEMDLKGWNVWKL
jgi:ferredoxin-NADP reductase